MHQHILIPVALDQEELIPRKIQYASRLLNEGGRITLLTVLEDVPGFVAEFVDMKPANHLSARIKSNLDTIAAAYDNIETSVLSGKPGLKIAEFAKTNGVDLIIVGSHNPKASDYFLGSTASRAARRAPCSVFILR